MVVLKRDVLAGCPLFRELGSADLEALAGAARREPVEAGNMLFFANAPVDALRVVVAGAVKVFLISPHSGREVVLTVERPYAAVAELPTFDGGPYPANAQAVEDGELLLIEHGDFERALRERPTIALHVVRTLGGRLRRLVGLIEQLSFQEVVHRLAADVLAQAQDDVPFELDTNADIAARIGTVPELVSRNLARLQHGGALGLEGRRVTWVDVSELRSLASAAGR